jgi:RNA 2',3'-cyclic 3'-phosphodiesterase
MPRHDPQSQSQPGGPEPARPTDRLFFAVFPDPATATRIATLARSLHDELALQGRPFSADRLHVTLQHLGDYAGLPPGLVDNAERMAASVMLPPFEITFDSVSSFACRPRNRPLVLRGDQDTAALVALQEFLGEAMALGGLAKWIVKKFVPHVTLLYDDRSIAPQPIVPIAWTVREFVLVHSLLGKTEHRILGRWSLRD